MFVFFVRIVSATGGLSTLYDVKGWKIDVFSLDRRNVGRGVYYRNQTNSGSNGKRRIDARAFGRPGSSSSRIRIDTVIQRLFRIGNWIAS